MRVVAGGGVTDLVRNTGGRLFVRTDLRRCCSGGVTYLVAEAMPDSSRAYSRVVADGFELFVSTGSLEPPNELQLEVKGWKRKRVEAYWNGCVFVV